MQILKSDIICFKIIKRKMQISSANKTALRTSVIPAWPAPVPMTYTLAIKATKCLALSIAIPPTQLLVKPPWCQGPSTLCSTGILLSPYASHSWFQCLLFSWAALALHISVMWIASCFGACLFHMPWLVLLSHYYSTYFHVGTAWLLLRTSLHLLCPHHEQDTMNIANFP